MQVKQVVAGVAIIQLSAMYLAAPSAIADDDTLIRRRTVIQQTKKADTDPVKVAPGTTTTEYRRGVQFKGANVFDPKYNERISNLDKQISTGLAKGWLTSDQANKFRARLAEIKKLNATLEAQKYPKDRTDTLEKLVTKFNSDLSTATSSSTKPTGAEASVKTNTNSSTTTKTTK